MLVDFWGMIGGIGIYDALVALFILNLICIAGVLIWRGWPVVCDFSQLPLTSSQLAMGAKGYTSKTFDSAADEKRHNINITGKVGELATALMLVSKGWRQFPSQPDGIHGLDGLFFRRHRVLPGYQFIFVETKASQLCEKRAFDNYSSKQMAREKILEDIDKLSSVTFDSKSVLSQRDAVNLKKAICRSSFHVRSFLYVHDFNKGSAVVYPLNKEGRVGRIRMQRIDDDAHHALLECLSISVGRLINATHKSAYDKSSSAMTFLGLSACSLPPSPSTTDISPSPT